MRRSAPGEFWRYQTADGDFRYDVNDFDDALIAPCSLDLIRCTASILLAADVWSLSPTQACTIACDFLSTYQATIAESARAGQIGEIAPGHGDGPIWDLLGETASAVYAELLDRLTERDKHGHRRILRSADKRPEVSEQAANSVRGAIEALGKTLPHPDEYQVLDVTGRIAGIGSLGVRRYLVLVAGKASADACRLLDVKECTPSSVLGCTQAPQPDFPSEADRVVQAQCRLQAKPAAGLAVLSIEGRPYRVRSLVPDENRSKLDRLHNKPEKLHRAVTVVGQLVGWSHARGCPLGETGALAALASWTAGPGLSAILVSAVRCAAATSLDFQSFQGAYSEQRLDPA